MRRAWGCLQDRSDFLRVAGKGVRRSTPAFLLQAAKRPTEGPMRVGFTASRKIGNAVVRNRAKRRLRAAADAALTPMFAQALDLVLVARHACLSRDFADMSADLRKAADAALRQLKTAPT